MKLLLVYADFLRRIEDKQRAKLSSPSFGVNYLATILRKHGHKVIVLDTLYEYLRTGCRSPIDVVEGTRDILKEEKDIEVVGISVTSPTRNRALRIAEVVKNFNRKIKVIAGGPHVTILPEKLIERFSHLFDYLVISEGDETLPQLIEAIEKKLPLNDIHDIAYNMGNGEICRTNPRLFSTKNDLDKVPYTDYFQYKHLLPDGILQAASLVTSRGCPYRCSFCYSPKFWGEYRTQSPNRVVAEIEHLVKNFGVRNIRFQDDTFTVHKKRCINIFKKIKERKFDIEIYMHTRFDVIDEDIIKAYAEAGGRDIFIGLESGSEKLRKLMGKDHGITNEVVMEKSKLLKYYGINTGLWLIFGYPSEREKDVEETYRLLQRIEPDQVICDVAHVHPFTPFFEKAREEGIYEINDWLSRDKDFFPYAQDGELEEAFRNSLLFSREFSKKDIKAEFEREVDTAVEKLNSL